MPGGQDVAQGVQVGGRNGEGAGAVRANPGAQCTAQEVGSHFSSNWQWKISKKNQRLGAAPASFAVLVTNASC